MCIRDRKIVCERGSRWPRLDVNGLWFVYVTFIPRRM